MNPDRESVLTTPRLQLEPLAPRHAEELMSVLADARLYHFIDDYPPRCVEELVERFARWRERRTLAVPHLWLNWAVRMRGGDAIGTAHATVEPGIKASIGCLIAAPCWRRGYASEVVAEVVRLLADGYGVPLVTATVDAGNTASIRLMERCGFARMDADAGDVLLAYVRRTR
jgi:[ribosomal protein S5]-alanine N-acetyltransferase